MGMDFILVCICCKLPTNFEKVSVKSISDQKDLRIIYGPITKQQFSLSWPLGKQAIKMPFFYWCLLILCPQTVCRGNISFWTFQWPFEYEHLWISTVCSVQPVNAYIPSLEFEENSFSLWICYILQLPTKLDFSKG